MLSEKYYIQPIKIKICKDYEQLNQDETEVIKTRKLTLPYPHIVYKIKLLENQDYRRKKRCACWKTIYHENILFVSCNK